MNNVLLTISYDGTDFCGWQRQDKSDGGKPLRTVQGEIERALKKMFKTQVSLYGSGRTDSGVHAFGQAANFTAPVENIPEKNYVRALNGMLPPDIRIMDAKYVDDDFNSRFSATSRVYRYFIKTGTVPFANESRYVWCIQSKPSLELLNSYCSYLKGEIDCATFSAAGDQSVSTHRYLEEARFYYEKDDVLVFQIEANAFLWKMVRSLIGTLVGLAEKNASAEVFEKILESCDRSRAGITAPPTGLFLYRVKFDGIRRHV